MITIAGELAALSAKAELLRAEDALAWAQAHPESALHGALEWDDGAAAHAYRLSQVRRLIAIHVVDQAGDRRLVSLSIDRSAGGGYRKVADVVLDPERASVMLRDALNELERTRKRYEKVRALASVWREVDEVVRQHRGAADAA